MRPDTNHSYLPQTRVYGWSEVKLPNDKTLKVIWKCHVYPKDDTDFKEWMSSTCPSAYLTWRFNNGNSYYDVTITDEVDASKFAIKWL